VTSASEIVDGLPTYDLYIGGQRTPASRNEAATSCLLRPENVTRVHQAGAAKTERAITAAHGAFKAWANVVASEREAAFLSAADVIASKAKEITDVLIEEPRSVAGKAGFKVDLDREVTQRLPGNSSRTVSIDDNSG
jgi:vanillin dehydrogenase